METNICKHFVETVDKHSDDIAVIYKSTTWLKDKWKDYQHKVSCLSSFLLKSNIHHGDKVAIFSANRYAWAISDFSIFSIRAITVPIYASNTAEDLAFILNDSNAKAIIIDTLENYNKWLQIKDKIKSIEKVICLFNPPTSEKDTIKWEDAMKAGYYESVVDDYKQRVQSITTKDIATIVYTSGTTGQPKGVILSHEQILSEVTDIFKLANISNQDTSLSFLPMAHIMGRIEVWGHVYAGFTMGYAESIDTLRDNFLTIKPTFLVSVPRVFEKIYNGVISYAESSPLRMKIFKWALSVGKQVSEITSKNESIPVDLLAKYKAAKVLVFNKLIEKMGGRIRYAISGGAPLSKDIAEFFHAAGLLVLEGYGLTETTAGVTFNAPHAYRFGTVGKPFGDVEIKFSDENEILVKSKKVMLGYHNNPEATAAALKDGWLHTGDIGTLTHDGFLKISERKKDLIKTSGGKYVAPQKIENLLKLNKFISNVLIHGDNKKYLVCLVTLNIDNVKQHLLKIGASYTSSANLKTHPEVIKLIREAIAETNQSLASFETIKNFAILDQDFTIEAGELTPSMKVKRNVCDVKYKDIIDSLYNV